MAMNSVSHRSEKRGPTDREGKIKLGFFKSIACDVQDLSASGAQLILPDETVLPKNFELHLSGTGRKRSHKCINRWQKGNAVGVEFLSTKIG